MANFRVAFIDDSYTSHMSRIDFLHFGDTARSHVGVYVLWLNKLFLLPRIAIGSDIADMDLIEMPWLEMFHSKDFSLYRYFILDFVDGCLFELQERGVQFGYDKFIVMIRVAHCQHGGSFQD